MKKKAKPLYRKKGLPGVTTRDYIDDMKAKPARVNRGKEEDAPLAFVQETAAAPSVGATISVRSAKAHLSALLDQVAAGREVVITSDGIPKARLVPMVPQPRKRFTGTREHLKTMPPWRGGVTSDEIIREDRDARG